MGNGNSYPAVMLNPDGSPVEPGTAIQFTDSTDQPATSSSGGSASGLSVYSDGSDGDITVNSDTFNWPDASGVTAWQASHAYVRGDRVKTLNPSSSSARIWECQSDGTSGSSQPSGFDAAAGDSRRGNRIQDDTGEDASLGIWWEQATAICDGVLEGPVFADTFDDGGHALRGAGWIIFARTAATISGTLSAAGIDASGATGGGQSGGVGSGQTLLGLGVNGADGSTGVGVTGDSPFSTGSGTVWGGGIGGNGGAGDAGVGGAATVLNGSDVGGFTLSRRSLLTLALVIYSGTWTIGSSGASGAGDGVTKNGGGGGSAGCGIGVFAKALTLTGTISCKGGDGAAGETGGGNTGGGGGGSGGCCVLVYNTKTGSGTVDVSGGTGGAGQGTGSAGKDGNSGDFVQIDNS